MTLSLHNLSITLGAVKLVTGFSVDIAPGDVVTVMGPSGAGKSTLLSAIGGDLESPFVVEGDVLLQGQSLNGLPPEKRGIARLFQDDFLFPHMTVAENLMFAVPLMERNTRQQLVMDALRHAELKDYGPRAPHTLSGGQRQRIAVMRALLSNPKAILLDEPFSQLDAAQRDHMRDYVFAHIRARGVPALLVTHDRSDAPVVSRILAIDADGVIKDV